MVLNIGIVGGGAVGSAVAFELSRNPNYQVSVWETRSPDEFGATGAALGVLMAVISPKLKGKHLRLRLESIRLFDPWVTQLQEQTGIDIPYNQAGIVQLMFNPEQIERWAKTESVRSKQGFRIERWSRDQTLAQIPFVTQARSLETGQPLIGSIYSPYDRQINPKVFTQACRQAAAINGATLSYNTPIESFETHAETESQQVVGAIARGKTIPLDVLILSAGLGTTPLSSSLKQPIAIHSVLGQAMRLRLRQPWPIPIPVINGEDVHLVPLNSQELWVGATVEFSDPQSLDCPPELNPSKLDQIHQQAIALCSDLADATIIETWSGLRPRPFEKAAPLLEWFPPFQNVILATGHYRNGILLAPITASVVADLIQQRFGSQ